MLADARLCNLWQMGNPTPCIPELVEREWASQEKRIKATFGSCKNTLTILAAP